MTYEPETETFAMPKISKKTKKVKSRKTPFVILGLLIIGFAGYGVVSLAETISDKYVGNQIAYQSKLKN